MKVEMMWPFHWHRPYEWVGQSLCWNKMEYIVVTKCKCGKALINFVPVKLP